MTRIEIRGLAIRACHGVHDFEKQSPQRFIFDADIYTDFYAAVKPDDLNGTVNYSAVCALIEGVALGNTFNLIEKLAYECAFEIFEKFACVTRLTLTVNKPDAPVKQKFESVAVTVDLQRVTAYLSLGSSMGDKKLMLDTAIEKLNAVRGVQVNKVSSYLENAPYGGVAQNTFLNCAAEISTVLPPETLLEEIHRIEAECGRVRGIRWGDRTLDIDIIFYGSKIINESNLVIPHPDYHNRTFVLTPLKEIAPDFLCPVRRTYIKNITL